MPTDRTALADDERDRLARAAVEEAAHVVQTRGDADAFDFAWVDDFNGLIDLARDLVAGRELRRDDRTRKALGIVLAADRMCAENPGAHPDDIAAARRRIAVDTRALRLAGEGAH